MKKDRILTLLDRSMNISKNTPVDVFFEYAPHVKAVSIYAFLNGWKPDALPDIDFPSVYLPGSELYSDHEMEKVENAFTKLEESYGL